MTLANLVEAKNVNMKEKNLEMKQDGEKIMMNGIQKKNIETEEVTEEVIEEVLEEVIITIMMIEIKEKNLTIMMIEISREMGMINNKIGIDLINSMMVVTRRIIGIIIKIMKGLETMTDRMTRIENFKIEEIITIVQVNNNIEEEKIKIGSLIEILKVKKKQNLIQELLITMDWENQEIPLLRF